MRCCKNGFDAFPRAAFDILLAVLTVLLTLAPAWADNAEIRNPQILASEEGYALSASLRIDFNDRLAEVAARGVTLYFVLEFELERPRWYWTDEVIARKRRVWRLSYHALTRQYRLSTGALHQSFATLEEALQRISRIANWTVVETALKPGDTFQAGLRFWLDISQLPKLFQLSVMPGREWEIDSGWLRWQFTVPSPPPSPASPPSATASPAAFQENTETTHPAVFVPETP
ncbi:MAG: DUF4390 domain-containing protein [Zoogloeaceae bacterium]|jgi:hypothetical protein|nr:DUF4390 domain-containing protein [Zoogloeaceae bacterium]